MSRHASVPKAATIYYLQITKRVCPRSWLETKLVMMAIAMAAQAHFHWTIFLTTYKMLATKVMLGRAQFLNKNYSQSGFDFQVNFHDNCKENY